MASSLKLEVSTVVELCVRVWCTYTAVIVMPHASNSTKNTDRPIIYLRREYGGFRRLLSEGFNGLESGKYPVRIIGCITTKQWSVYSSYVPF